MKKILITLAPLIFGALSWLVVSDAAVSYQMLVRPPLSPTSWVFPAVWTVLYIMMGTASLRIYSSADSDRTNALYLFYIQLAVNIIWPFIFFGLCQYLVAFLWIILLWLLILDTTVTFGSIDRRAGFLLIPYMLWISFAAYLNLAVFFLN